MHAPILTDEEHVRTGTSLRLLLDLFQAHLASIYHKCERKKREGKYLKEGRQDKFI
jgi:hypothetical protein